jgi:hypothetical protein
MPDWMTWQTVAQTAWDWGSKIGLGGVIGWFLQRWIGSRDKTSDRGRARVEAARPEAVPIGGVFMGDGRATIHLRNRGSGAARGIRVTFTGSAAHALVNELEPGARSDTPDMKLGDSLFFREAVAQPAELTVSFQGSVRRQVQSGAADKAGEAC